MAKALRKKYASASSFNDKIEILERLASIGITINSSDFSYALEEAENLKGQSGLTYAQKLRLGWLLNINPENESQIVADLLPQTTSSFDLTTLAIISDLITAEERKAVLNRYFDLFDAALSASNIAELGKLFALAANRNSDQTIRPRLTVAAGKIQVVAGLSLSERRLNPITAEIYQQIDTITGEYDDVTDTQPNKPNKMVRHKDLTEPTPKK